MNASEFNHAIKKIDLPLSDVQIGVLFGELDVNKDGYIDKFDWMRALPANSISLYF